MTVLDVSSAALAQCAGIVFVVYVANKYMDLRQMVASVGNHPGARVVFSPAGIVSNAVIPIRLPGIALGRAAEYRDKYGPFEVAGSDVLAYISAWPNASAMLSIADASVVKEITTSRARFPKPVEMYKILCLFGQNLLVTEGEEWKKMRKISAPAFNDKNNRMVWDETAKIMSEMFSVLWGGRDRIVVDHVVDITLPIALFVIGVAGFGREMSWRDDDTVPVGHKMGFKQALHLVSTNMLVKLVVPNWALGLTKRLKSVRIAFSELEVYIIEMIHARKSGESKSERNDLFTNLMDANSEEDLIEGAATLSESDLVGNIFIFLIAGHETTAHTLAFTFGLLALYQNEQEKLYQHIKSVMPESGEPTYDDMPKFTHSLAVFYETLRLFPPVPPIPKYSAEDTVIQTTNLKDGSPVVIPVPKGTSMIINVAAIHNNPRYWKDPEAFNPDRFLGDWPRDAFLPFSMGARACIGRKFFETEGIAILTMLISKFKIEVKPEPKFANETFEQRKARVLQAKPGLTVTPVRVPLIFTRR